MPEWSHEVNPGKRGPLQKIKKYSFVLKEHNLEILEPIKLEQDINDMPGVVTNGIFALRPADKLLVSGNNGIEIIEN